jgi:putative oxidoreductase
LTPSCSSEMIARASRGETRRPGGTMQKYIPSLVWYRPFEPYAYAFIRFCTGAIVLAHGVQRLFLGGGTAELGALRGLPSGAVGAFELTAGALLALGLLTRPVALLLTVEWVIAAMAVPVRPGQSWIMLGATPHYPAMVAAFCFAFVLGGGGHCSVDHRIGKEV